MSDTAGSVTIISIDEDRVKGSFTFVTGVADDGSEALTIAGSFDLLVVGNWVPAPSGT